MSYSDSNIHLALFKETKTDLEKMIVIYASEKRLFLGEMFTFNVIGWSHFVSCPSLLYNEIVSGIEIPNLDMYSFDLIGDKKIEDVSFDIPTHKVKIEMWVTDLKDNPPNASEEILCHVFPNTAYTALIIKENSYETIHSYPEFNRNLYTRTTFTKKN